MKAARTPELAAFMSERHAIYRRRFVERRAPPWTADPILQTYRFCNVYRELDTVTIWIRENIRERYREHQNLWFMLCMARQINLPETLHEIMQEGAWPVDEYDWRKVRKIMLARQKRGDKLYTSAYMLNAHGTKPTDPTDKAFFTTKLVLDSVWKNRARVKEAFYGSSMEEAWRSLLPHHGWGGFTAYEVVCDAQHTRYSRYWSDVDTWAYAGPGALRGLNRVFGRETKARLSADWALQEMRTLKDDLNQLLAGSLPPLGMREVEHSLCEFDKYERVRTGEGRPKEKFHGGKQ